MPFMTNPNLPADELIEVLEGAVPHHERSGWVVCDAPLAEDDFPGPVWLPHEDAPAAPDAPAPASEDAPPAEPDTTSEPSA